MRYRDLSPADQQLVSTDLGQFDKLAHEQLAVVNEMYDTGFNKIAHNIANDLEEQALAQHELAKHASEEQYDDGIKTASAEYGAFIERGVYDGLRKLGSERYGDEMIYLMPFVEEKIAEAGKAGALRKFFDATKSKASGASDKVKGWAGAAKSKVNSLGDGKEGRNMVGRGADRAGAAASKAGTKVKNYHRDMKDDFVAGATGRIGGKDGLAIGKMDRAKFLASGAAKASPYIAAGGLGTYAATRDKQAQ